MLPRSGLCVGTLPPRWVADPFRVSSLGDSTIYIRTGIGSLPLGALEPGSWPRQLSPGPSAFVPANAAGWRVTSPGGTVVTPADNCD